MTHTFRRIVSVFFIVAVLTLFALPSGAAAPVVTEARCAWLYNVDNDTVLFSQAMDEKVYPTGLVKMMTALVAIENYQGDWNAEISVTKEMVRNVGGNRLGLKDGNRMTFYDLLGAMIVGSANDAATVLAYAVAGSPTAFVAMMNARAAELGMTSTVYTNVTGLHDPAMVTTTADTALLARFMYDNYKYMEIAGSSAWLVAETEFINNMTIFSRNFFISKYYNGDYVRDDITGMSSGATNEGGCAVVATASCEGADYICIVTGAVATDKRIGSYTTAAMLLDWAYENYGYTVLVSDIEAVCELPVALSAQADGVAVMPEKTIEAYLPEDFRTEYDLEKIIRLDSERLTAPVSSGARVGSMTLMSGGKVLGEVTLVTRAGVARSEFLYILSLVTSFFTSRAFFIIAAAVALCAGLYAAARSAGRSRRRVKR